MKTLSKLTDLSEDFISTIEIHNTLGKLLENQWNARIEGNKILITLPADCVMKADDVKRIVQETYNCEVEINER